MSNRLGLPHCPPTFTTRALFSPSSSLVDSPLHSRHPTTHSTQSLSLFYSSYACSPTRESLSTFQPAHSLQQPPPTALSPTPAPLSPLTSLQIALSPVRWLPEHDFLSQCLTMFEACVSSPAPSCSSIRLAALCMRRVRSRPPWTRLPRRPRAFRDPGLGTRC